MTGTTPTANGILCNSSGINNFVYNNSIFGPDSINDGGVCVTEKVQGKFENNFVAGCNALILSGGLAPTMTMDYNVYANCSNSYNCWSFGSADTSNFATWQGTYGYDSHSVNDQASTTGGLNSSGVPQAGSPVIGAGTNLTNLGITALDSDLAGNARPSTGAWDIGAYEYSATTTIPQAIGGWWINGYGIK
jgi:hypothetical protein